jgi:hypothetical protein
MDPAGCPQSSRASWSISKETIEPQGPPPVATPVSDDLQRSHTDTRDFPLPPSLVSNLSGPSFQVDESQMDTGSKTDRAYREGDTTSPKTTSGEGHHNKDNHTGSPFFATRRGRSSHDAIRDPQPLQDVLYLGPAKDEEDTVFTPYTLSEDEFEKLKGRQWHIETMRGRPRGID